MTLSPPWRLYLKNPPKVRWYFTLLLAFLLELSEAKRHEYLEDVIMFADELGLQELVDTL